MKTPYVTVETPRLKLRPFADSDFEAFARMSADPEVMRYLGDGCPVGRINGWFEMASFVGHWHLRGFGEWVAEEKVTGAFVGRIGLQRPESGQPPKSAGYSVASTGSKVMRQKVDELRLDMLSTNCAFGA